MTGQKLATIKPVRKAAGREVATVDPQVPVPGEAAQTINEFQYDTVEMDAQKAPFLARSILWVLGLFMISVIAWASFAQIDRIVTAKGKIISIAPNIVIQPLDSAIIRSINVAVGDVVKAGTVLATLDPTFAEADVNQIEAKIASLDAAVDRLEAEQKRRVYVPDTSQDRFGYGLLQEAIFKERQTQYIAQVRQYEERIERAKASINQRMQERDHLIQRLKILREVESMRVELEQSKTGSRLNSLLARDSRIEVERNLSAAESTIIQNQHEMTSYQAERDVFERQWDSKTIEELVTKRNERDGLTDQLIKARKRQSMISLETPVDAVVLEIAQRSVGSIIKDAEPFFKLVPLDSPIEVEGVIEAREIGYVGVGDPVQLKIEAYSFQEHGMAEGVVKVISSDAFVDSNRSNPDAPAAGSFYKARIELTKIALYNVPDNFRLIPGMPLSAEIKVGKRSVVAYFLRPILRGINESMREP